MKKVATLEVAGSAARKPIPGLHEPLQALSERALLGLHRQLQGTLGLSCLVNRFFGWLAEQLPVASIEYVYPDEGLRLVDGEARQHSAHYVLRLEQRYLGEVTLTAQQRMSERHLFAQEQAMGVLVHCVKNALDHLALEKVAYHDSLTGVMNRTALDELLPKEVDRARRYDYDLSVAMIDIDHFKAINDQLGHLGADAVLREVAGAIKGQLRSSDLTFRYGGDEFLVVLPGTAASGARSAAQQIMRAVDRHNAAQQARGVTPQLCIGVASLQMGDDSAQLLSRADRALYDAKQAGRNCIR